MTASRRALAAAGVLLAACAACAACGGRDGPARSRGQPPPPAGTTAPAGPGATPSPDPACASIPPPAPGPVRDGYLTFEVREIQDGVAALAGTHAEFEPNGRFMRVRVAVRNPDNVFHEFATGEQEVVDDAGTHHQPDYGTMAAKRQPMTVTLGSGNLTEFDLWYDLPVPAVPAALRVRAGGCGRLLALPRPHA